MTESTAIQTSADRVCRGDLYVAYGNARPAERLYVRVTRVAKDASWADLKIMTWAVAWSKRMKLPFTENARLTAQYWDQNDLDFQEEDHMAKLAGT